MVKKIYIHVKNIIIEDHRWKISVTTYNVKRDINKKKQEKIQENKFLLGNLYLIYSRSKCEIVTRAPQKNIMILNNHIRNHLLIFD